MEEETRWKWKVKAFFSTMFSFCSLWTNDPFGVDFFLSYYGQYGLNPNQEYFKAFNYQRKRVYKRSEEPRVPFVTHRIWFTLRSIVREMEDVMKS